MLLLSSADFFKKLFQEHYKSVKPLGPSRSGPTIWLNPLSRFGSKLFAKVISRQQKSPLARKSVKVSILANSADPDAPFYDISLQIFCHERFCLIFYIPVNDFSVMSGQVFLGWTSTKQKIKCLAQELNAVLPVRLWGTHNPSISTTEQLRSSRINPFLNQEDSLCRFVFKKSIHFMSCQCY